MNSLVKSFLLAFIIAAVVFSAISIAAFPPVIKMVFEQDNKTSAEEETDDGDGRSTSYDKYTLGTGGTLAMLLICTDELPSGVGTEPAESGKTDDEETVKKDFEEIMQSGRFTLTKKIVFITLAVFDSLLGRVSVTSIPCETVVSFRGTNVGLDEMLYITENGLYGTDIGFFPDYVMSLTGYTVDMYGFIDVDDYVKFADEHKGLTLELHENVSVTASNGRTVSYRAGTVQATSAALRDLITFDGYSKRASKSEILESYSLSVLGEITTLAYYSPDNGFFDKCVAPLYASNADHDAFEAKKELFFSCGIYTHAKINVIGAYSTKNGVTGFYPDAAGTLSAFK